MRIVKKFKDGNKTDSYSGLNTNISKDPVKQAETESTFDWENVRKSLKAQGLNLEMHPDTLAYVEKVLRNLGLEGDPLNIALADALIESGGRPSRPSGTSKYPTYWGLWQQSKQIIPLEQRTGGLQGVLDQANVFVNGLRNVNTWTNGAYPDPNDVDLAKTENRKPNMVQVGYANRKEPFNIFWGIIDPEYKNMYTLRNIPRNAKVKAFTDAKQRPLNRKDYAVRLAKAVKALEESVKRYLSNK